MKVNEMNRVLPIISTLLAWLLAAFFLVGAYGNAFISEDYAAAYAGWGYPDWFHYVTAVLELTAAILLLLPVTRPYGATLGAVVMAAATLTTLVNGDYDQSPAPAVVFCLSLVALALCVRVRRRKR